MKTIVLCVLAVVWNNTYTNSSVHPLKNDSSISKAATKNFCIQMFGKRFCRKRCISHFRYKLEMISFEFFIINSHRLEFAFTSTCYRFSFFHA